MKYRHCLIAYAAMMVALVSQPAIAQGVVAEVMSERTPTFLITGERGPIIDGRSLIGRQAKPEGDLGLMGVDTPSGHVLVRRSAVIVQPQGQAPLRPPVCDKNSNLAASSRNYGSNGFGEKRC